MEAIVPGVIVIAALAFLSAGLLPWLKGRWRYAAWAWIGLHLSLHLITSGAAWRGGDIEQIVAGANRLFLDVAGLAIVSGISWGFGAVAHIVRATRNDCRRVRGGKPVAED